MSNNDTYELIALTDSQYFDCINTITKSASVNEEILSQSEKVFKYKENEDECIVYISKFRRTSIDIHGASSIDTILFAKIVGDKVYVSVILDTRSIIKSINCSDIDYYDGNDRTSFKWRICEKATNTINYYHLITYVDDDNRLRVLPHESTYDYKRNVARYYLSSINNDGFEKVVVSRTIVIKPKNFSSECKAIFKHSKITEDLVLENIVGNIHLQHGIIDELYIVNGGVYGWLVIFEYDFQAHLVSIHQYIDIKVDDDINSLVDNFMVRLDTIEMAR